MINENKIWIVGCNGQLGSEISKLIPNAYKTDIELDISNEDNVLKFAKEHQIECIINCSAYTDVERAETEAFELNRKTNITGVYNLTKCKCKLIHISTDYVFDGKQIKDDNSYRYYNEEDNCHPINYYGIAKYTGEQLIINNKNVNEYIILRVSYLFGKPNFKNIVSTFKKLINEKEQIEVIKDQTFNLTSCVGVSRLIKHILDIGITPENSGIYHYTCIDREILNSIYGNKFLYKTSITPYKLACYIKETYCPESSCKIDWTFYSLYQRKLKALRPKHSALDITKLIKTFKLENRPDIILDWREAIEIELK